MSGQPAEIAGSRRSNFWLLALATAAVAMALGYAIAQSVPWLPTGFNLTQTAQLVGLLVGTVVALTILRRPEIGLVGLMAVVFTNASDIGMRFYRLPSLLPLLVFLLFIALAGRQLFLRRYEFVWDPLLIWLIVYGAVGLVSSSRAENLELANAGLFEYLKSLCILFLTLNLVTTPQTLRRAVWVLILSGTFLATLSLYQVFTHSYHVDFGGFARVKMAQIVGRLFQPRIAGPLGEPNFYAQSLLLLVPLTLYRLWDETAVRLKLIATYALWVILLGLIFTYSRGGAVGLGVVLLAIALNKRVKGKYLLLSLLLLMPLVLFIPEQFGGRLRTLSQLLPGQARSIVHVDSSFRQRALLMRSAEGMFWDHPFLGVGVGNYPEEYVEYAGQIGSEVSSYQNFDRQRLPHSLYLEVAAETGGMGFTLFAVILVAILLTARSAIRLFRQAGDLSSANLATSLAIAFIGYLTTSIFLHGDFMRYFWLLAALIVASKQIARRQNRISSAFHPL